MPRRPRIFAFAPRAPVSEAPPDPGRALRAALWMTLAAALFAGMNVVARFGSLAIPWQEVALSRFLVGIPMMLAVARMRGVRLRVEQPRAALWRSFFGTCAGVCTFYSLSATEIGLGDVVTLLNTSPIFVALLSFPILGEPVRGQVVAAMGLAALGVVAIVRPSFHIGGSVVAVALGAAVCSSLAMMALRRLGKKEPPEAIVLHFCVFGSVVFALLSIPVWRTPDAKNAIVLLLTGLLGNTAQLAMTRAYSLDGAARVAVIGYSGVVFTRLYAAVVFGEVPSALGVLGSVLIIASGALVAVSGGAGRR